MVLGAQAAGGEGGRAGDDPPHGGAAGRVCRAERGCPGRAAGSPGAAADSAARNSHP